MTDVIDDGGPAFPIATDLNTNPTFFKGLTKREIFAGMALQGILSSFDVNFKAPSRIDDHNKIARLSYELSDAMIRAAK